MVTVLDDCNASLLFPCTQDVRLDDHWTYSIGAFSAADANGEVRGQDGEAW